MRYVSLVPSAGRLMGSLRDLGYELPQAVAELVDNSIDANATVVDIDLRFDGARSWLRVVDNGEGMTGQALDEAMRFGSSREYGHAALGGFGLGLKTASFSQCRRLTVASRRSVERRRIEVRRWDLDNVEALDDWLLERLHPADAPVALTEPLERGPGTSVLWENLDRVLMYRNPEGGHAEAGFNALRRELEQHLAMVFHRFITGEARRVLPLTIRVNGHEIEAWDPYARSEEHTQALPETELTVEHEGRHHTVRVRPYLLPSQQRFSTPEAHQLAGGPRKWNRQQGLYIYREDRLIQSGGWNRLRTQDEHTKLARIGVDIPRGADELFGVNVSKMRVTLPESIRPAMRALVTAVTARAQDNYRDRSTRRRPADAATASGGAAPAFASLLDVGADFIPRARVVELLRAHLSEPEEAGKLRALVNAVLMDEWREDALRRHAEVGPTSAEPDAAPAGA